MASDLMEQAMTGLSEPQKQQLQQVLEQIRSNLTRRDPLEYAHNG